MSDWWVCSLVSQLIGGLKRGFQAEVLGVASSFHLPLMSRWFVYIGTTNVRVCVCVFVCFLCVCVCVCVCVFVCFVCVCVSACVYLCFLCVCLCVCPCLRICVFFYVCVCACVWVCVCVCVCVCVFVFFMCVCVCFFMCVSVCVNKTLNPSFDSTPKWSTVVVLLNQSYKWQSADCYKETLAKYLSELSHGERQPPQFNQSCCSIYNQDSKTCSCSEEQTQSMTIILFIHFAVWFSFLSGNNLFWQISNWSNQLENQYQYVSHLLLVAWK